MQPALAYGLLLLHYDASNILSFDSAFWGKLINLITEAYTIGILLLSYHFHVILFFLLDLYSTVLGYAS